MLMTGTNYVTRNSNPVVLFAYLNDVYTCRLPLMISQMPEPPAFVLLMRALKFRSGYLCSFDSHA